MSAVVLAAAIVLPGMALSSLVPAPRGLRLALALPLGLGVWSGSFLALLFAGGAGHVLAKDLALVALSVLVLLRFRKPPLDRGEAAPRWLVAAFVLAVVVAAAVGLEHVYRHPEGGYDAWMIWNLRARFFARDPAGFRAAFSPSLLIWAHADYPAMLPGLVAQFFLGLRSESLWIPGLVGLLFGAIGCAVLTAGVGTLRGPRWGLLAGLCLLTTPCLVSLAANQQADVPLAAFLLASCALVALAVESGNVAAMVLAGLAAGMTAWTKNEGLLYAGLLTGAVALFAGRRALLAFLAGAAPFGALLGVFKTLSTARNDLAGYSTAHEFAARALDVHRWLELAGLVLRRLVYFQSFALWAVAALLVLVLVIPRVRPRGAPRLLLAALCAMALSYAPVYVLQPHELGWFFRASADRVFIQLWPSLLLAIFLALAQGRAPATADT